MSLLKQTKSVVGRGDLSKIARIAGLSESTVIKWWHGELSVKLETEQKILDAAGQYITNKKTAISDHIKFIGEVEGKMKEIKSKFKKALAVLK